MTPAKENNGSKATIREVFNLLQPISEAQIEIKTTLTNFIETYKNGHRFLENTIKDVCEENENDHKEFLTLRSAKNFTVILGIVIALATILNTILFFFKG